jgi:hypothetical protein
VYKRDINAQAGAASGETNKPIMMPPPSLGRRPVAQPPLLYSDMKCGAGAILAARNRTAPHTHRGIRRHIAIIVLLWDDDDDDEADEALPTLL